MSHIETGNTKLSLQVLVSLSEALEVRIDDLIFGSKKTNRNALIEEIVAELEECTSQQILIINDIVNATKTSINKYI